MESAELETLIIDAADNGVVTITMNRPKRLNAASSQMFTELRETWNEIGGDPTVRCVVMTGAGDAFCSGADLAHENDEVRRDACYGISALGSAAVDPLVSLLGHENDRIRGYAVYALGDIRHHSPSVAERLAGLSDDTSPFVRQNVADALGQLKLAGDSTVPALIGMMKDEDEQVRSRTAYALARFGDEAQAAIQDLADACYDENRYVQGHAAVALEQIGTPEALSTLLHWLQASRWCPLTTAKSTY